MPAKYEAIRDGLIERGYPIPQAKRMAAKTFNAQRDPGADPVTGMDKAAAPASPGAAQGAAMSTTRNKGQQGTTMRASAPSRPDYGPGGNPAGSWPRAGVYR